MISIVWFLLTLCSRQFDGSAVCSACPQGKYSTKAQGNSVCTLCDKGEI
jgi:hypothetical protein